MGEGYPFGLYSTSFPCIVRSGTLPEDVEMCGYFVLYAGEMKSVQRTGFQPSWNRRRGYARIPGKNQQASAKAGKAHHRRTLSNYLRRLVWGRVVHSGCIQPPFRVLSAQGPYLKMQDCAVVLCCMLEG